MQIAAFISRSRSSSSSSGHLLLVVSFSVGQVSLSDLGDFFKAAFNFLQSYNSIIDEDREVDLGTFVDKEEGDIDDKSDVELDLDLDLDLDSGHNDDDLESDTEIVYSPIQWIELALQRNFNSP